MSKPELVHERDCYGFTLRHSHANDYAVLVDAAGNEQEFAENLGMVAQGAPSATLLAITAAKRGQADNEALRKSLLKAKAEELHNAEAVALDTDGQFKPIDELESEGE